VGDGQRERERKRGERGREAGRKKVLESDNCGFCVFVCFVTVLVKAIQR